ncbi:MAG TPA: amidase [Myxococcota bacterium]|nr:amidase [Myxococcota bacterium]
MRPDEYESHDALGLASLVQRGEIKPRELIEVAIAQCERRNPAVNAVVIPMFDEARRVSEAAPAGPFHGVPFLLKDLYALYPGVRTTNGSRLFSDFVPDHENEMVARYRRAGLVVFGKSASPEFGITTSTESVLFGKTRNPWNLEHTAGGSSGGAAAAVAAGIVPAAHASDGGGSIRIPASCCGLFGLKPSRGLMPFGPDAGEGWSGMSTAHAVTRSVRDSAALLDVVAGADLGAPYAAPTRERPYLEEMGAKPGRLRIALQTRSFNGSDTHPDCVAAARDAAALCRSLGHEVDEAEIAIDAAAFGRASQVIIAANLRASVQDRLKELGRELRDDDLETGTRAMFEAAAGADAAEYARSLRVIHALGRQVSRFLLRYELLLTPTMGTPPLPLGRLALTNPGVDFLRDLLQTVGYTQLFNASGHPAMSVPLSWNAASLPIGVQFVGRFGAEATLFRVGAQLEQARPWFAKTASCA